MATEAIEWVDCHEEFKKCVSQLSPGMVVTAPNIRLQDIISAVEILDPRTDFHSDFQCVRSLDDLCRDGEVPTAKKILDTFGEEDYTGVFEILWVRLFQWLEGRTLPQSLFSCTYMHELERLESVPFLHAFMCGLLKVVSYCTEVIARADVREEDEFPLFSFNVNLCAECDTRSVVESLEMIENLVAKKKWSCALPHIQLCKSLLILVSRLDVGMKEVEKGLIPFLHEMKIHIDNVNEAVKKGETQSGTVPFAHRSASKSLFHEATTRWVSAMTPLNYIPYDALLAKAETFSKTIGAYFRKLVDDLHEICEGLHFFSEDVTEMLSFVLDFSARAPCLVVRSWLMTIAYHGETQVLFGRCNMSTLLLQTFTKRHGCATLELMANGEENTLKNVTRYRIQKLRELKKYCPDFVLPDTSNEKGLLEMTRQQIIDFMNRLGRFVLHALFAVLNNRARYRRRLGNIFSELALLQKLAWEMDVNIFCGGFSCLEHYFIAEQSTANAETCEQCHAAQQAIILSAFVVDLVARCMLDFTLLGIELELYAVEELPYAYGYTGNILTVFGENYSVLYKPKDFLVRNHLKNKKTTQRLFPPIVNAREMCLPSQSILHRHDLLRLMTAGTERTHQILVRVELLCPTGVRSINTLQHKYNHRFQVFEDLLRPSMFRFEACQRHIDAITMGGDVAHVIASAVQIFEHLMTRFEETRQILSKTAERLCQRWKQASMANLICVRLVKSLMGHEGIKEYTAVAEYHHGWITYKLVRKNTLDGGRVKA